MFSVSPQWVHSTPSAPWASLSRSSTSVNVGFRASGVSPNQPGLHSISAGAGEAGSRSMTW